MQLLAANDPIIPRDGSHTWEVLNFEASTLYYVSWLPAGCNGNEDRRDPILRWWTPEEGEFMMVWCPTLEKAKAILAKMYDYGIDNVPIEEIPE
jgi:hypothetical protein